DVQGQGRLAGRLRSVDLDHATAGQAADTEREIEPERPGGDHVDLAVDRILAQPHDRPLAELLVDRSEREVDGLVAGLDGRGGSRTGGPCRTGRRSRGVFAGHLQISLWGGLFGGSQVLVVTTRPAIVGLHLRLVWSLWLWLTIGCGPF